MSQRVHAGAADRSHRLAPAIAAGVFSIAAVVLLWYLFDVLLLIFGAVLLAVVFRAPTDWIAQHTRLNDRWSLVLVLAGAAALLTLGGWLLGAAVREQTAELAERVPEAFEQLRRQIGEFSWLNARIDVDSMLEGSEGALVGRGLRVVTTTFGALANFGLILFLAVLFAVQPSLYVHGVLRLTPIDRRDRMRDLLDRLDTALRRWMVGQLLLMIFVGVASVTGLYLLDVPYALALGLLAGLLTFVPFIGPLLAALIAILISLGSGLLTAVWVGLLYLGVQIVEGLLEPIVQQRTVYLPPALLISAQIVLGVLVGVLGVILATPLAAVLMVIVQMLYIEDVLGDPILER